MLLKYIENAFIGNISGSRISINVYDNWLSTLNTRKEVMRKRFYDFNGSMHLGVNLLKHILSFVDIKYLRSLPDDFKRYTLFFANIERTIQTVFDMNTTGIIKKNMFIANAGGMTTQEYIIPAFSTTPIKSLPLDEPWNDKWKKLHPLNYIDTDSKEYTLDTYGDKIKYRVDYPIYAVFSLDPVKLGFMYYKYLESRNFELVEDEGFDSYRFIHRWVLTDLIDDMQDIWLRNSINSLFDYRNVIEYEEREDDDFYYDNMLAYRGAQYTKAMAEILKSIIRIRNGERPDKLLNSIRLTNCTLIEKIKYIYDELDMMNLNQYVWQLYMRDNGWVELLANIYGCNPNHSTTRQLANQLFRKADNLYKTSFWRTIPQIELKYYIQNRVEHQIAKYKEFILI